MTTPAGSTRPKKPRPKYRTDVNGKRYIIDAEDNWAQGTLVWAFTGEEGDCCDYEEIDPGTYSLVSPSQTMVIGSDSKISSIS